MTIIPKITTKYLNENLHINAELVLAPTIGNAIHSGTNLDMIQSIQIVTKNESFSIDNTKKDLYLCVNQEFLQPDDIIDGLLLVIHTPYCTCKYIIEVQNV